MRLGNIEHFCDHFKSFQKNDEKNWLRSCRWKAKQKEHSSCFWLVVFHQSIWKICTSQIGSWNPPIFQRKMKKYTWKDHLHPGRLTAGTYKSPILKGTWSSKPPWLCSMLIFRGVVYFGVSNLFREFPVEEALYASSLKTKKAHWPSHELHLNTSMISSSSGST